MATSEEDKPEDNCGISTAIPLIIGGEKVQPKEFPHMAAIGYGESLETANWMCGGSLISEIYILTAAHCLQSHLGEPRFVKLGVINVAKDKGNKNLQIYEIMDAISHPRFNPPSQWNDIALLRLSGEVELTAYVRPACLDYSGILQEETALATGWGVLELGLKEGSPELMKVELDIIEKSVCNKIYKKVLKGNVNDSLMCAGVIEGGRDTCQGDSGGPLQAVMWEPYCVYSIVGITSFGSFCGMVPSIYSRVFYYVPWIESEVWPNHQ